MKASTAHLISFGLLLVATLAMVTAAFVVHGAWWVHLTFWLAGSLFCASAFVRWHTYELAREWERFHPRNDGFRG